MNSPPHLDWSDLAEPWHADAPAVSVVDIDAYLVRERRQLLVMTMMELSVSAVGVATSLWLAFMPRFRWMGLLIAVFALASAIVLLRARRHRGPTGTADLLESLRESIAYQEWLAHELRFGRALHFIALLAIVSVLSVQLRDFQGTSMFGFAAIGVAAVSVLTGLGWNLVLSRRARRRAARLRDIAARFSE